MILLKEKFRNTRIILASGSPRRKYLLGEIGIDFEVIENTDMDETYPGSLSGKEIPVFLANKKSEAWKNLLIGDVLLITADTIVWCDKKVLNKPAGRNDAIKSLLTLSGRSHEVISGVCLRSREKTVSFSSVTSVSFRKLKEDEIVYYVDTCRPYDKAGAYGIQEWIGYIGIESITGSYFNVMGLPVDKLYRNLECF